MIHYARFEKAFLQPWHDESAPGTPFAFEIIGTHALARKLLPDLPRCGLRALAGDCGMRLPIGKRCAPHVTAAALIWEKLVAHLTGMGIGDSAAQRRWMQLTTRRSRQPRVYPMPVHLLRRASACPGFCRFRRANGDPLYVGKAKSLRNRIGGYFQQRCHSEHILEMLTQAVDLDSVVTATSLQAALLEAEDIHRLQPEYNIQLQTGGQTPVFSTRDFQAIGPAADPGFPMGPFPSRRALAPPSRPSALTPPERYDRIPPANAGPVSMGPPTCACGFYRPKSGDG